MIWVDLLIVAVLIGLNAFFALSEIAVVSSRPARLQAMASDDVRGAAAALRLTEDPTGFLSAVQIGITLVAILSGAFGEAQLSGPAADLLSPGPPLWLLVLVTTAVALVVALVVFLGFR